MTAESESPTPKSTGTGAASAAEPASPTGTAPGILADHRATLLVALVALAATGASVACGFTYWDDDIYVFRNPLVLRPSFDALWAILTEPYYANYQPLHLLSYWVDRGLWDLAPAGIHAFNVLLYAAGCALLHRLALRLGVAPPAALAGAALYAAHPVHVEPVAWVSARKDCLMLPLLAGACLLYSRRTVRARIAAFGLAAAACLAKSQALVIPGLLLAMELVRTDAGETLREKLRGRLLPLLPYVGLSVVIALAVVAAQGKAGAVKVVPGGVFAHIGSVTRAVMFDLRLALFPYPLSAHYDLAPSAGFGAMEALATLGLFAIVGLAIWCWRRRLRDASLGAFTALWFFAAIAPVSGVVPLAVLAADRYLLLPTFGLCLLAAAVGYRGLPKKAFAGVVVGCTLVLAIGSVARTTVWESDLTLWQDTVASSPGSGVAWANYGAALADAGLYAEALTALDEAERLRPGDGSVFLNRVLIAVTLEAPPLLGGGALADTLRRTRDNPVVLCSVATELRNLGAPRSSDIVLARAAWLGPPVPCIGAPPGVP